MRISITDISIDRIRRLKYAPFLAIAMGLIMLRTLLVAHYLPLSEFANYSAGLLISSSFCMLVCLGLQPLLQREMPVMVVRGRLRCAAVLMVQSTFIAIFCLIIGFALTLSGLEVPGFPRTITLFGLLHGLSQQLFVIATVESRSRWETMRFARQNLIRGVFFIVFSVLVARITMSAYRVLAVEAAITIIFSQLILWNALKRIKIRCAVVLQLSFNRLKCVRWKAACTLLFISAIVFLLLNMDRWAASQFLIPTQFARYSFAAIILVISGATQVLINASAYPLLARRYATDGISAAFDISWKLSACIWSIVLLMYVPVYYGLVYGIQNFYPKYNEIESLISIFLIVGMLRVSDFWSSFMIITGQESRLLFLNLFSIILGLAIWFLKVQPWRAEIVPVDVAELALILNLSNYLLVSIAAYRVFRKRS